MVVGIFVVDDLSLVLFGGLDYLAAEFSIDLVHALHQIAQILDISK
jgi:hypothetical protein